MKACEPVLFQLVAERENDTRKPSNNFEDDEGEEEDAKSVMTITTGVDNRERIDEEDEQRTEHRDITEEIPQHNLETDEEKHRRREELGRPKTPEPTGGIDAQSSSVSALSEQVKAAVKWALEAQRIAAAQATIEALEKKERQTTATMPPPPPPPPPTIPILVTPPPSVEIAKENLKEAQAFLSEILSEWKNTVQGQWSQERERLNRAREEFEIKTREFDDGLEMMASLETSVETMKEMQTSQGQQLSVLQALVTRIQQQAQESDGSAFESWFRKDGEGVVVNGEAISLATPNSPRSRSSGSARYRRRRKKAKKKEGRERSGEGEGEEIVEGSASKSRRERGVGGVDTDTVGVLVAPAAVSSLSNRRLLMRTQSNIHHQKKN
ncbi:hypothetical protein JOM56_014851 [Amanita muscaria]